MSVFDPHDCATARDQSTGKGVFALIDQSIGEIYLVNHDSTAQETINPPSAMNFQKIDYIMGIKTYVAASNPSAGNNELLFIEIEREGADPTLAVYTNPTNIVS